MNLKNNKSLYCDGDFMHPDPFHWAAFVMLD